MTATTEQTAPATSVGEVSTFQVTLRVRRFLPEGPRGDESYWDDHVLTMHGTDRVLDALHKIKWEIDEFALARIGQTGGSDMPFVMPKYVTTVVQQDYYVKGHLRYSGVKISKSGRVIKVSGKASGSTEAYGVPGAFKIKMRVQKKTDSGWKTVKTVSPTSVNGAFKLNYKVGSAGTYRVLVSHEDLAHWYRQKTTKSVTVK